MKTVGVVRTVVQPGQPTFTNPCPARSPVQDDPCSLSGKPPQAGHLEGYGAKIVLKEQGAVLLSFERPVLERPERPERAHAGGSAVDDPEPLDGQVAAESAADNTNIERVREQSSAEERVEPPVDGCAIACEREIARQEIRRAVFELELDPLPPPGDNRDVFIAIAQRHRHRPQPPFLYGRILTLDPVAAENVVIGGFCERGVILEIDAAGHIHLQRLETISRLHVSPVVPEVIEIIVITQEEENGIYQLARIIHKKRQCIN